MRNTATAHATTPVHGAANDGSVRAEILAAYERIKRAFESGDAATIKALVAHDHRTVTPVDGATREVWNIVAAGDLVDYTQTPISEIVVEELAPGVALQHFNAALTGRYQGEPVPAKVAITIIWEQRNGKWLERYFQFTPLRD